MDFSASLDYLYGLQLFGVKLGLENMQALRARLPLLQEPLACVHVAGTNGKGSVSVLLAEALRHSGLKVGLYTSPHLHCFTERIRIDGTPISRQEMVVLADDIRRAADGIPVTFFEATTAMALLAFRRHRVDIAVIETGLGGRLDATNIVEPLLCVITPISLDHSEHLGDTLPQIAGEKAGIIKPGVPVVVARQGPEARDVLAKAARERGAEMTLADRDYWWKTRSEELSVRIGELHLDRLRCALAGRHQLENYALAIAALARLRDLGVTLTDQAMRRAGETVSWPGRLEWVGDGRRVLLDVSHNRAGVQCLADYLVGQGLSNIHLVVGMSGERMPAEVLKPLEKYVAAVYAVPVSFNPPVPTAEILSWAGGFSVPAVGYESATEGLEAALRASRHAGTVVVCGSLYLVAELRQHLLDVQPPVVK